MIKKCLGCGATMQFADKNKQGYIRQDKYDASDFCERCFKIKNYGTLIKVEDENDRYIDIYKNINNTNDLVLYLVDIFNINSSIDMINKYIKNRIILVITKFDIIPKSVKENKVKENLKQYNFNNNIVETIFISSKTNYNLDRLYNLINEYKTSNNVYITGNTNAGKSTLINKIINNYSENDGYLTTSILPSTTISENVITINDELTLIDTPGFIEKDNISNYISAKELKKVMPHTEIRPVTYQLDSGKTLYIEPYLRLEYVNGDRNSFTFYISNDIIVNRINTITNVRGKNLVCHKLEVKAYEDVVVNGLCFIKITKDASIKIFVPENVGVYKRKSLI